MEDVPASRSHGGENVQVMSPWKMTKTPDIYTYVHHMSTLFPQYSTIYGSPHMSFSHWLIEGQGLFVYPFSLKGHWWQIWQMVYQTHFLRKVGMIDSYRGAGYITNIVTNNMINNMMIWYHDNHGNICHGDSEQDVMVPPHKNPHMVRGTAASALGSISSKRWKRLMVTTPLASPKNVAGVRGQWFLWELTIGNGDLMGLNCWKWWFIRT